MKIDVAIIGGGPAGLTAGIFVCRAGRQAVLFEELALGGQVSISHEIANYPGFNSISGMELADKMREQAEISGLQIKYAKIIELKKKGKSFILKTNKDEYEADFVIIATGAKAKRLGLTDEEKFIGRGVSYCASCDGNFFKNKTVSVVGGGDSAVEYAEYLSKLAKKVYLINRSEKFRAGEFKINKLKEIKNIEILENAKVEGLIGNEVLEKIKINANGKITTKKMDGVFVAIGHVPDLSFVKFDLSIDKLGYVVVDKDMKTSMKHLYACGDIVSKDFRQVITACSDGAIAGNSTIGGK